MVKRRKDDDVSAPALDGESEKKGKPKKHNIDKAVKKQKTEPEEVVLVKAKPKKVKEEVPPKKDPEKKKKKSKRQQKSDASTVEPGSICDKDNGEPKKKKKKRKRQQKSNGSKVEPGSLCDKDNGEPEKKKKKSKRQQKSDASKVEPGSICDKDNGEPEKKKKKRKRQQKSNGSKVEPGSICDKDNGAKTPASTSATTLPNSLFVANLSGCVDVQTLKEFFKDVGDIIDIQFDTFDDGSSRGFARVEFPTAEAVEKACLLNGKTLMGQPVKLNYGCEQRIHSPGSRDNSSFKKPRHFSKNPSVSSPPPPPPYPAAAPPPTQEQQASAMAPTLVLSCKVFADSFGLQEPVPERPASRPLSCVTRRAIGVNCSDDADKVLRELRFDTHLADAPALSRLTLGGTGVRYMSIVAIDYKLIVLGSRLPEGNTSWSHPSSLVYLVYDAVEQSITMISSHPWSRTPQQPGSMRETAFPMGVLIARTPVGYALVNMAQMTIYSRGKSVDKHDLVYIWRSWLSPAPRWDMITAIFPAAFKGDNVGHSYTTVLAFSCGGLAFWVNLLRGVMYCRLDALLSASDAAASKLEFRFISLPAKLPPEIPANLMCAYEMCSRMFRTMGRAGKSSIKFVSIEGFLQHLDFVDCTLMVWSLSPEISLTNWTKRSLCLGSLVEQDSFREACLPTDMVPMYPILNPGEDNVIYFMLGKYEMCCNMHTKSKERCDRHVTTAGKPLYQLRVDMSRGVLLGAARLPDNASPSEILADNSVVPSPMIHGGSTVGRKLKRRRGRGAVIQ